jgi:hypothetical protein
MADIKLKHGVLGLTKHLAQSASQSRIIHAALTEAGIIQRIAASGVWDEKADVMVDVIQLNAIGVVKHLCRVDGESECRARDIVHKSSHSGEYIRSGRPYSR